MITSNDVATRQGLKASFRSVFAAQSFRAQITTFGGGALITPDREFWREIMMYATQYRESYPYYQYEKIGYNYRMSSICAGNYWLCTITIDPSVRVKGQENAYQEIITGAVGGAAGVIHAASSATTDCQPHDNVEALRVALDQAGIEARPVWKPMHKQPCYKDAPAYVNGVSESIFKVGMCLPAGPCVLDDDVKYIVESIKANIL